MADKLPTFETQEKLEPSLLPQGIGRAAQNFAQSNTFLGDLGAKVAQSASNALNEKMGYEAGKDPDGSLFIPITDADKVWKKAYDASAYQTLSNQATEYSIGSQLELSKLNKLSSESIEAYASEQVSTRDKMFALAPDSIKGQLEANFNQSLAISIGKLNEKKISQDKKIQQSQISAASSSATLNVAEIGHNGQLTESLKIAKQTDEHNESLVNSGAMSPADFATEHSKNQIMAYSSFLTKAATESKRLEKEGKPENEGALSKNLAGMFKFLEGEKIPFGTQLQISAAVSKNLLNIEKQEKESDNLALTGFKVKVANHSATVSDLNQLNKDAGTQVALDGELALLKQHSSNNQKSLKVSNLNAKPMDVNVLGASSAEIKNAAWTATKTKLMNEDKNLTENQANIQATITYGGEIPQAIKTIEEGMQSQNSIDMEDAIRFYDGVSAVNPNLINSVSSEALGRMEKYKTELNKTKNPHEATVAVNNAFSPKEKERLEQLNKNWDEISKKKFATDKAKNNIVKPALDDSWGLTIMGENSAALELQALTKSAYMANDGDWDSALAFGTKKLRLSWGTDTTYTGDSVVPFVEKGLITKNPIQRALNLPTENPGIVQSHIVNHLTNVLSTINANPNNSQFKLVKRNVSGEEANDLKNKTADFDKSSYVIPSIDDMNSVNRLKEFKEGQNIQIVKIDRNKHHTKYDIFLASTGTVRNSKDNSVSGWQYMAKNIKTGQTVSLAEISGQAFVPPLSLNPSVVQDDYIKYAGSGRSKVLLSDVIAQEESSQKRRRSPTALQFGASGALLND